MLQRADVSLGDDGLMMATKMLRLRSSSQIRDVVNTHGDAGGGIWLRPSVCARTIGPKCRQGLNRQGSEADILPRLAPGCGMEAGGQTDRQICIYQNRDPVLQTDTLEATRPKEYLVPCVLRSILINYVKST